MKVKIISDKYPTKFTSLVIASTSTCSGFLVFIVQSLSTVATLSKFSSTPQTSDSPNSVLRLTDDFQVCWKKVLSA